MAKSEPEHAVYMTHIKSEILSFSKQWWNITVQVNVVADSVEILGGETSNKDPCVRMEPNKSHLTAP